MLNGRTELEAGCEYGERGVKADFPLLGLGVCLSVVFPALPSGAPLGTTSRNLY